jgi:RimJ/RimL family protein N-acetyltransferase
MVILTRGKSCEIRPVGSDSREMVLGVYRACENFLALGPQPNADMAMVLKDLEWSQQHGGLFCGIHDATGRMIGVVDFVPSGFEGQPQVAFFSLIMVVPSARRRGVGTEAVGLIERELRRDPLVAMIRSAVQVNNPEAQWFWLKRGYKIVGGPEARLDGTTVLNLHKDLSDGA